MKFCTVLHSLNSPQNVGMIVRSHTAHGGSEIVFTGHELPWNFKKESQAFSRKLEAQAKIIHIPEPEKAVEYLREGGFEVVAIEINANSNCLASYAFSTKVALVIGNEGSGLPAQFLELCDAIVTIPQYGRAASLNVAVSASIAMYEIMRGQTSLRVCGDEYVF